MKSLQNPKLCVLVLLYAEKQQKKPRKKPRKKPKTKKNPTKYNR
jgi:hypothetical protein